MTLEEQDNMTPEQIQEWVIQASIELVQHAADEADEDISNMDPWNAANVAVSVGDAILEGDKQRAMEMLMQLMICIADETIGLDLDPEGGR